MHPSNVSLANTTLPPQQKPIRFVSNNDGPYAKRRRINSACLTCRRRKTRCSGERPVCNTCTQNNHECGGYGPESEQQTQTSPNAGSMSERGERKSFGEASESKRFSVSSPTQKRDGQHSGATPGRPEMEHTFSAGSTTSHYSDATGRNVPGAPAGNGREDEDPSPASSGRPLLSLSTRNRMPYFRYFGPTAIMPGFKQMVVKVKGKQHSTAASTSEAIESPSGGTTIDRLSPSHHSHEPRTPLEIPIYDISAMSPSPLITHLCKTFFIHLGCNFPFLQQERFMRDLEEKQVDAILVDAVCAIAARFSTHPLLTGLQNNAGEERKPADRPDISPPEYGQAFAQRAKSAICDTFACPSVAVVQAALLLAYDEFGASRDSGLWMYLGISIRMAQDLGMQKLEGLRFEGRNGPTPKMVKTVTPGRKQETPNLDHQKPLLLDEGLDPQTIREQRAVERERIDTFWAVFFLDRVISSGTGRPVTLRDRDIEISFPSLDEVDPITKWPMPFPALIRIIHLYGRVTDLLNSIKEVSHVTPDVIKRLGSMESHLTDIYQGLSPQLHFNAVNFQHYVKAGQGTNFILLHFWFHTLIVLLHQPTLLHTFEGRIHQLLPNSRELSMSSAKTIADILAFAELIDAKASVGNPFTSQPIYIAACAFIKETALHSASSKPSSRPATPPTDPRTKIEEQDSVSKASPKTAQSDLRSDDGSSADKSLSSSTIDQKQVAKHTLLATAANQNYQRCYRALQSLETYWAGTKYILTVLDQKAKGVGDPLLYTREEMESALELPKPEPAFTSPGWRRKLSWGTYLTAQNAGEATALLGKAGFGKIPPGSPMLDKSQAIGWSLTGTMNSPSSSLAVLYTGSDGREMRQTRKVINEPTQSISSVMAQNQSSTFPPNNSRQSFSAQTMPPPQPPFAAGGQSYPPPNVTSMPPPQSTATFGPIPSDPVLVSDADLLLNLHSPFSATSPRSNHFPGGTPPDHSNPMMSGTSSEYPQSGTTPNTQQPTPNNGMPYPNMMSETGQPFGDMMIESQDIDMSALGDDMMPWLEYLPHDLIGYYDPDMSGPPGTGLGGVDTKDQYTNGGR